MTTVGSNYLYKDKTSNDADKTNRFSLDLAYETNILNGVDSGKINVFLNAIVYGDTSNPNYGPAYNNSVELPGTSLYDHIKNLIASGHVIKEYMGKYYQNDSPNTPEANKIEKNVITYVVE